MRVRDIYPKEADQQAGEFVSGFFSSMLIRTNFLTAEREKLGWRGLRFSCVNGEAWTCRVKGVDGVFGIWCVEQELISDTYTGRFNICYFPGEDDDYLEDFSVAAAVYAAHDDYRKWIRDFLCYPGFYEIFNIGQIKIGISNEGDALACTMLAHDRILTRSLSGVYSVKDGRKDYLVEPGGTDQDLPAFSILYSLFEVICASLSFNLGEVPSGAEKRAVKDKNSELISLCLLYGTPRNAANCEERTREINDPDNSYVWREGDILPKPFGNASWWNDKLCCDDSKSSPGSPFSGDKPYLTILTGYLGAGKTTFLKNFIEYQNRNRRFVAVIQNEIGETGLDTSLLEDDYAVVEMDEGCVCCSLIGQLKKGISTILEKHNPDTLILETTGLANPLNLMGEIEQTRELISGYSVITVVDALNYREVSMQSVIVNDQIIAANAVLINKCDLTNEITVSEIRADIRSINPGAMIFECTNADINPAMLYSLTEDAKVMSGRACHQHNHTHGDDEVSAHKLNFTDPLDRDNFIATINSLGDRAYRIKGILSFSDSDKSFFFQYVNGRSDLSENQHNKTNDNYLIFIGKTKEISGINKNIFINNKN